MRRRRPSTPWLRNGIKLVFAPPVGRSPIRAVAFVFGRLAFFIGMALFGWTVSVELFGPGFASLAGDNALGAKLAGGFGIIAGIGVGLLVPFMEAFGFYLASLEEDFWPRQILRLVSTVCCVITLSGQLFLVATISYRDSVKRDQAMEASETLLSQGAAIVNTEELQRQLDAMNDPAGPIARAQTEYDRAILWQNTALACPDEGVCEDIRPVQRALGVLADGIVRSAGDACATCGQTMTAINDEVERTRTVLADAEAARKAVSDQIQARIDDQAEGRVVDAVTAAADARNVNTISDRFNAFVSLIARVAPWAVPQASEEGATFSSDVAFIVLLCIINILSASLNNTGHNTGEDEEDGPEPAPVRLIPQGPAPTPRAAAIADLVQVGPAAYAHRPAAVPDSYRSPPVRASYAPATPPPQPKGDERVLDCEGSIARLSSLTKRLKGT